LSQFSNYFLGDFLERDFFSFIITIYHLNYCFQSNSIFSISLLDLDLFIGTLSICLGRERKMEIMIEANFIKLFFNWTLTSIYSFVQPISLNTHTHTYTYSRHLHRHTQKHHTHTYSHTQTHTLSHTLKSRESDSTILEEFLKTQSLSYRRHKLTYFTSFSIYKLANWLSRYFKFLSK